MEEHQILEWSLKLAFLPFSQNTLRFSCGLIRHIPHLFKENVLWRFLVFNDGEQDYQCVKEVVTFFIFEQKKSDTYNINVA